MIRINSKPFIILVILTLTVLATIAYISFTYVARQNKYAVRIDTFPRNAQLNLDDKQIKRGTLYLEPGSYTVKASSEGFIEHSAELVVGPHIKTFILSLEPENQEGRDYFNTHQSEYAEVRKLSERAVEESGKYFHEKNPIAAKLPYKTFTYSIGHRLDKSDPTGNSIIVVIDAPEGYKQAALYRIRQLGFDPTDLNINFRDYENPFPL